MKHDDISINPCIERVNYSYYELFMMRNRQLLCIYSEKSNIFALDLEII